MERTEPKIVQVVTLSTWDDIVDALDFLSPQPVHFRGQADAAWTLRTSLEREFEGQDLWDIERQMLWRFARRAPGLLPPHLVPSEQNDAAAWLGLIQHYGGPTRLLDVSRSPYVGLYFAFETPGQASRALWAIESVWCSLLSAQVMAANEGIEVEVAFARATTAQMQLVYSLVHRQRWPAPGFATFLPFTGVFPLDPWRPDTRQIAQQALFICAADLERSFIENLSAYPPPAVPAVRKFIMPASLRVEVLERLALMNVTAATLFPDLGGLARSLRTMTVRRRLTVEQYGEPPFRGDVE